MKIALIGPTNIDLMSSVSGISKCVYIDSARKIGELIAKYKHNLVIVPDRGVAVEGLFSYKRMNGPHVIAIYPKKGETEYQSRTVKINEHIKDCNEVIDNIHWYEQHPLICQISDIMVCCGISCGTLSEMAWTKWIEKPVTYVCRNTISSIPPEMLSEAHIKFIDTSDDFEGILKKY